VRVTLRSGDKPINLQMDRSTFQLLAEAAIRFADDLAGDGEVVPLGTDPA
jgi:hypothetical protein